MNPRKPNLAGPAEPASQPQTLRPTCARVAAPRHLIALIAAAVLPLATHAPQAAAQGRPEGPVDAPALRQPSPYLPHTHWAARALARLNAAGLGLPGYDAGRRTPRLIEVAVTFERAATNAADPALRARAAAWLRLLQDEFGRTPLTQPAASADVAYAPFGTLSMTATASHAEGGVGTGTGYAEAPVEWSGTVPFDDDSWVGAGIRAHGALARFIGFDAEAGTRSDDIAVTTAYGSIAAGPLVLWGGRRTLGFGAPVSGAVTIADGHSFDGGGIHLAGPIMLPWIFRYLGPFDAEAFLTRAQNGDGIGVTDPWLGAMRISIAPHQRLSMGATRAVMFGGDNAAPATASRIWQMLLGDPSVNGTGEWSNEVFGWNVTWRPPLGSVPLEVFFEHGFDDASGAYWRAPAIIAGAFVPFLPGLPALGLGAEYVYFSSASDKNPIWYRNFALSGGWTHERRPLGHPIAGHGQGAYGHASLDLLDARLRLRAATWLFDRGDENLLAPEREGLAAGTQIDAAWRILDRLEMSAGAAHEDGAGWQETTARLQFRYTFDVLR